MNNKKICVTADCVCDLSDDILKAHNIEMVYFYIVTDTGIFRDVNEITANNIFEYLRNGGKKSETKAPSVDEFVRFFRRKLKKYDEIIHIAISSKISLSVSNCREAVEKLGDDASRVHIFDSGHLSTGIGHIALKAAELAESGTKPDFIIEELESLKDKVSTTFIANNADYLYRNGKVSKGLKNICSMFNIHPVLEMRDGRLCLKSVEIGNYERSIIRYVRKQLKKSMEIDPSLLFITHAGCTVSEVKLVKREVNRLMTFDKIKVTRASATISGNSGPGTIGVLFVNK